jgi:hypothetical protein
MELHLDCIESRTSETTLLPYMAGICEKLEKTGRCAKVRMLNSELISLSAFVSYHRGDATETDENLFRLAFQPDRKVVKEKAKNFR